MAERIAGLIDGPVTEALLALLTDLYGDALARVIRIVGGAPGGAALVERLCDDSLVGGLLVVHDLHPQPVAARIERALAGVGETPNDRAHAALDRIEDGTAYVRLAAPAGPAMRAAIARAVASAAPEIAHVSAEVDLADDRTLHVQTEVLRSP